MRFNQKLYAKKIDITINQYVFASKLKMLAWISTFTSNLTFGKLNWQEIRITFEMKTKNTPFLELWRQNESRNNVRRLLQTSQVAHCTYSETYWISSTHKKWQRKYTEKWRPIHFVCTTIVFGFKFFVHFVSFYGIFYGIS